MMPDFLEIGNSEEPSTNLPLCAGTKLKIQREPVACRVERHDGEAQRGEPPPIWKSGNQETETKALPP